MNSGASSLVYLTLPEAFLNKVNLGFGETGFQFNPAIPLPLEVESGTGRFNPEDITLEMMLAGMLRAIAKEPPVKHHAYYCAFVVAMRPSILRELSGAALTKAKNGDFPASREIIALLKMLFPASARVLFMNAIVLEEEAESLLRSGKEDAALAAGKQTAKAYNEALSVEAPLPDALFNAAFFYMKQYDFGKARDYFQEYVETAGSAKDDVPKKEAALKQIRIIQQKQLDDCHYHDAYTLICEGKEEEGMRELRLFLEKRPDVHNAWFMLGWALRRLRRWEDGAAAFRKALELGGSNAESRNELAICLSELGDLQAAKAELETALTKEPDNIKIMSNLGALYLKMNDKKTAGAFFRTVLDIAPDDMLAKQFLAQSL